MADADVDTQPTVADASEQAAGPREREELPPFDEALLVRGKGGKVKKPVRPDDTERNIQIEKLSAEVKKHSERIAEIKAIVMARRTRTVNPEAAEHKKKKDVLHGEWNAVLKQKMHIREEFQRCNTEREVLRNELREIRGKIPRGAKLDTLEADIQQLEYRIEHESISGAEEKKAHQQLQALTAARPIARQTIALEEKLKAVEANRAATKSRLDQCDAVLNGIKEKEQAEGAALDEIRRKREEGNVDIPALEVEKQECWEVIQAMRAKMTEVREDYNKKYLEWSELNKNYNIYLRHERRNQYEERQKKREEREANDDENYQAAAGPTLVEPYESEIFTIDQLLTYLRKMVVSEGVTVAKVEQKEVEVPKGLKAFKKKDADEDLSFFTAVEKKHKGGKAAKAADKAAPAEPAKKKLNHSLEILKTFMTFNIEVPLTTDKIAGTIEKAEAKKQDFLDMRKKAKEAPAPSTSGKSRPQANGDSNGHAAKEPEAEPAEEQEVEEAEAADKAETAQQEVEEEEQQQAEKEEEEQAEAAAAEEEAVVVEEADTAEAEGEPLAPGKSVGLSMDVDKATEEVSIKLKVSDN